MLPQVLVHELRAAVAWVLRASPRGHGAGIKCGSLSLSLSPSLPLPLPPAPPSSHSLTLSTGFSCHSVRVAGVDGMDWVRASSVPLLDTFPAHGAQPWEQTQIYAPNLVVHDVRRVCQHSYIYIDIYRYI